MKIFLSQPMRGKTEQQIREEREKLKRENSLFSGDVLDTIFDFGDANPIYYLAKSIEKLSEADVIVFMPGWEGARGCRIEFEIAKAYGNKIIILEDKNK